MSSKKEATILAIQDSAIKLFTSSGYNATSTAMIARTAGISEAIIFKYFKSKENLLKEISKVAISQIIENISIIPFKKNLEESKNYSLKDFIRSLIRERFEFLSKNFEMVKFITIEMQYSDKLKSQVKELVFPKVAEVFNAVKQILKVNTGVNDVKASAMGRIIIGVIESVIIQKYILGAEISEEEISNEIEEILNIIEKGCINL